jgi:hypothetical protein
VISPNGLAIATNLNNDSSVEKFWGYHPAARQALIPRDWRRRSFRVWEIFLLQYVMRFYHKNISAILNLSICRASRSISSRNYSRRDASDFAP